MPASFSRRVPPPPPAPARLRWWPAWLTVSALLALSLASSWSPPALLLPAAAWKLMMSPNYVHEDLVGKALALFSRPEDQDLAKQMREDLTLGDIWTDMPLGKDGELTHRPADIQGFLNLLTLSPSNALFLLKQSQQGCLMHWHCMAPKLQGRDGMRMSNDAVRALVLGQVSLWWDRAVATRGQPIAAGYIGHILHSVQDCHPRGHTIRDSHPLYAQNGDTFGAEDDVEAAVQKKLDITGQKCGRILYFQGDGAQNTAGVPPLDNDLGTHGGWDKLPHEPKSTLDNIQVGTEVSSTFSGASFKPAYNVEEAQRQLQLEACSVYASYLVIRAWFRCVRDAAGQCGEPKQELLRVVGDYVLRLPAERAGDVAGGAWERVAITDEEKRARHFELKSVSVSDLPGFQPIGVWMPKATSVWNVSAATSAAVAPSSSGTKIPALDLPLCAKVVGTTRDDFVAATKEAGPFTDFYNPVAAATLAPGGSPCTEDQECYSDQCGGSIFGQDYCACHTAERNCTSPYLSAAPVASVSSFSWQLPLALLLLAAWLTAI